MVGFAMSLMAVSIFYFRFFKNNIVYFSLLFLVILSTIYYWNPPLGWDKIDEKDYWNFPLTTTYFGETDIIWSEGPKNSYPKKRVELIGGKGEILDIQKKSNIHKFIVDAETKVQLVDHTQYFPGWRVFVDGEPVLIEFQDQNWRGEITFFAPQGKHDVKVIFGESKIRFASNLLTIFGVIVLFWIGVFRRKIKIA